MFKPVDAKVNFPALEEEVLRFWREDQTFQKVQEKNKNGEKFVFFEGPPTANAKPGIHHVLARVFKDLIPRYQTMQGKFVDRKAGWDTQGLPVELQVEKKLGLTNKKDIEKYGIAKFNAECKKDVWEFKQDWEKTTERIGYWLDLDNPYITYTNEYIESVWAVIKRASEMKDGLNQPMLYSGYKVVPFCTRCGTALSSHEVAQGYKPVKENSVFIKFKLKNEINNKESYIIAWTTTPWTLPGNVALAVGENIQYVVVQNGNENLILSLDLWQNEIKRAQIGLENAKYIETISGKDLVGLSYQPLFEGAVKGNDKSFKIYRADFVTTTDGSGVVHTAVMYGEDDYNLGISIGLPTEHTVGEDGRFLESCGNLFGMKVKIPESDKLIFERLEAQKNLLAIVLHEHDYPFCWRCDTPLLYYARSSWFIRMSSLRDQLVKNGETVNWEPKSIKYGRMGEWLENIKDWAISRERFWGTPLPIWICPEGHQTCVGSCKELAKLGAKIPEDLHRPYIDEIKFACPICQQIATRVPEVADVWLDSGAMPYAQWGYPEQPGSDHKLSEHFPADFICEAIDQTRGWFYTLMAVSTLMGKEAPYKNVICLGHIMDEHGKKMSKSKGNIIDPFAMLDKYGADALRLYFYSMNPPGEAKLFSEKDLQTTQRRALLILWNVYSYFVTYANLADWSPKNVNHKSENVLDLWILARQNQLVLNVTSALDKFDVLTASRLIVDFIDDLSTWYLRRSRNRVGELNSELDKNNFFHTMYDVLLTLSKLMAPFTPFISENIFQNLTGESVHMQNWPIAGKTDEKIIHSMKITRDIVASGLAARMEIGVKIRQKLNKVCVLLPSKYELDQQYIDLILYELNICEFQTLNSEFSDQSYVLVSAGQIKLWIDPKITPELEMDGVMRELIRAIQDWRKTNQLTVSDFISINYVSGDELISKLLHNQEKKNIIQVNTRSKITLFDKVEPNFVSDINGHEIKMLIALANK